MPEPVLVPRAQLLKCLRDRGWTFKKKGKRAEIYELKGSTARIDLMVRDPYGEDYVRVVLGQAGFDADGIEEFLAGCVTAESS